MGKFAPATYVKPVAAEKPNPFIADLKPFTDKGVDTAFEYETTAGEYAGEKLLIQKAVNAHGYSAREVASTLTEESQPKDKVKVTFLIRPARKSSKEDGAEAEADAAE